MNKSRAAVGWTTTSTLEEARDLCNKLLSTGLVACAQVSAPIESHYQWLGKTVHDTEFRITLKFLAERASEVECFLMTNHSYEVPQWLWIYADGASKEYLEWMRS